SVACRSRSRTPSWAHHRNFQLRSKSPMSRWTMVLCGVIALLVGLGLARVSSRFRADPTVEAPKELDLGLHDEGKRLETSLFVRNRGRQPLLLSNFSVPCDCLAFSDKTNGWGLDSSSREEVAPGGELEVRVAFVARRNAEGFQRYYIRFETNDPRR